MKRFILLKFIRSIRKSKRDYYLQILKPLPDQDKGINCSAADDQLAPEALLIKRLEHEINEQQELLNIKLQVIINSIFFEVKG